MAIEKLSDGRWFVDIEPVKGKRYRRKFKTKAEAQRFEVHIRANHTGNDSWNPKPSDKRRLNEIISAWFDLHGHSLRDGNRRLAKLYALSKRLNNPVSCRFEPQLYMEDRKKRIDDGISPKTLNNELGYLKSLYNELISLDYIAYDNPVKLIKPLRISERELSFLTVDQINELLGAIQAGCDNPHVELIVLICLATGARWSEAEKLKPSSVRNNIVTFSGTKSGKVRAVPISQQLNNRLVHQWKTYGLFTGSITSFRRALSRTSIRLPRGQATHALRHTFASHFIMNGGNILTLQKILGHSSLAMTMRYAHLSPGHLQDAIKLSPLSLIDTFSTQN